MDKPTYWRCVLFFVPDTFQAAGINYQDELDRQGRIEKDAVDWKLIYNRVKRRTAFSAVLLPSSDRDSERLNDGTI